MDIFDIGVYLVRLLFIIASCMFLGLSMRNPENRESKLRFMGLAAYLFASSIFIQAAYRAIEGKLLRALVLMGVTVIVAGFGFVCRWMAKKCL